VPRSVTPGGTVRFPRSTNNPLGTNSVPPPLALHAASPARNACAMAAHRKHRHVQMSKCGRHLISCEVPKERLTRPTSSIITTAAA
jgi:hypothetical protein